MQVQLSAFNKIEQPFERNTHGWPCDKKQNVQHSRLLADIRDSEDDVLIAVRSLTLSKQQFKIVFVVFIIAPFLTFRFLLLFFVFLSLVFVLWRCGEFGTQVPLIKRTQQTITINVLF